MAAIKVTAAEWLKLDLSKNYSVGILNCGILLDSVSVN